MTKITTIVVVTFVCVLAIAPSAMAETPKSPLQLDADPSGDLLLYNGATGVFFNTNFTGLGSDGFTYFSGSWETGWTLTPARLNNDSLNDVFMHNSTTGAYAWAINTGTGYTRTSRVWDAGWRVFVADFNADRLHDLLIYNPVTGQYVQCLNTGASDFTYSGGVWPAGRDVTVADFDGDSRSDVFTYNATTGENSQFLVTTTGVGFATTRHSTWSSGWRIYAVSLNGDRLVDLFLHNPTTGTWVQCTSTGTAAMFTYHSEQWSANWEVYPTDFDADGISDVFLHNASTGLWFVCITRPGGLGFVSYVSGTWSPGWRVYVTDFDKNGRSDLFLYSETTGRHFRCVTTGAGVFQYTAGAWSLGWTVISEIDRVPASPAPVLTKTKIMAFGDSITAGSHASDVQRNHVAYPDLLAAQLRARYPQQTITVLNRGLFGEKVLDGKNRVATLIDAEKPDLLLLLEGSYDVLARSSAGTIGQDLRTLAVRAQVRGVPVLIATLPPLAPHRDPTGILRPLLDGVNVRIGLVAAELGLGAPIDVFDEFQDDASLSSSDGVVPSDAGYRKIAQMFFDQIVARFQAAQ